MTDDRPDELCRTTATTIASLVRSRSISPIEVLDAVIARMQAVDPAVHAFCEPTIEQARADAVKLSTSIARGDDVGALAGVPCSVKDLIFTRGVRTAAGSVAYVDFVPDEDDVAVERIRAAGGIIIGKTTVPEFGYSATSVNPASPWARNPWNLALTPGGSSSGSAVAVASGMGPLSLGSDGGGSVRIPASFCGVFGMKPSMGRVPMYPGCRDPRFPGLSSWEAIEHLGPLTRTVADAALLLSVIAGPDLRDRHSLPAGDVDWLVAPRGDIAGLRIAFSEDFGHAPVDPEVRTVVRQAVAVFAGELGAHVETVDPGWGDTSDAFEALVVASSDLVGMREMAHRFGDRMSEHLVAMLNAEWTAEKLSAAQLIRQDVARRMAALMSRYDLLVTPTVGVAAFELGPQHPASIEGRAVGPFDLVTFTSPMNMTGQPAATVPAGNTSSGMPVGLQIAGPHLGDALVLRAAAAFEAARPWADQWPAGW